MSWQNNLTMLLGLWLMLATSPASAAPQRLVADLSQDNVEITSSYHGTELLLFGAFEGMDGDDVVLLVSGPQIRLAQRRSDKVAGICGNVDTNIWENAPSFNHVFSTRPLAEIAAPETLRTARIGPRSLPLEFTRQGGAQNGHEQGPESSTGGAATAASADMISGLIRNMQDLGLWAEKTAAVTLQQNMLFRATLDLPKNVPPGNYEVRVVHFRDGGILNEETTGMKIKKAGLSALIYNFAHDYSAFYGVFAIIFAVCSGWLAAVAFRRK